MKNLILIPLLILHYQSYSQNYEFKNTGNLNNEPYGTKSWNWDTSAYKHFSYTSTNPDQYKMLYRMLLPPSNDPSKTYPLFIMLHGAGEGIGGTCDTILPPNTCQLTWGARIALDSINKYPGFVFFPRQTGGGSYWGNGYDAPMTNHTRVVFEIIENVLLRNYNIDPDRIYIAGLTSGANAAWEFTERRPDLFAALTSFQGIGNPYMIKTLINTPIWMYQAGKDVNPSPQQTLALYDSLTKYGGNPRRSVYEDRDVWSWIDAYQSTTWLAWLYQQDKKKIQVMYGKKPEVCPDDSLQLGISYGYVQYQWSKNGTALTGQNEYITTIKDPGTYQVSCKRSDGTLMVSYPIVITPTACQLSPIDDPTVPSKPKILARILTLMGQEIEKEQALEGIFIYQYQDGSTRKIVK